MNIRPLGDRVVIKLLASEEVTKSGIVIPDTAKEKSQQGEVVAVGPGRLMDDGTRAVMEVKVGDIIVFAKYTGTEMKLDGVDYMILSSERDVLAIMDK
ncbi:MAG: co-chaperone GroES [Firmicutes bacterium]|nr:co-chaperone GroES [Bacillota bacterium]